MIEVRLEVMEGRMVEGDETVSLEEFARVIRHLRRMLESLGLRKTQLDTVPTIDELVAKHRAAKPIERAKPSAAAPVADASPSLASDHAAPIEEPA